MKKYSSGAGANQSLEDFGASNQERFDQFKGRDTTYDESLYTSKLDDGKITAEQRQRGLILEKEIKSQTNTTNKHQLEERGLKELELEKDETGRYESEEMLYSGVVRRDFKKFRAYNAEIKPDAFNQMLTGFIKAKPTGAFIVDSYLSAQKQEAPAPSIVSEVTPALTATEFNPNSTEFVPSSQPFIPAKKPQTYQGPKPSYNSFNPQQTQPQYQPRYNQQNSSATYTPNSNSNYRGNKPHRSYNEDYSGNQNQYNS